MVNLNLWITHTNASVVNFFVIWITVLLLVLWRITRRFFDDSGISPTRLVVGVISAIVEKELGERNFGFDSLRPAAHCREAPPPQSTTARQRAASGLLQIDVEVEEPETSENPTLSFVIHNIIWRRT